MTDADNFPVVGIGASAGGIQAMEGFFKGVPDDSGMAFVVVTHPSSDRQSLLHEVIGRYTGMAVRVISHDLPIEPNTVYVTLPNAVLTVERGMLHPRELDPVHRERKPIDIFFASLAAEFGARAIGVVLSGADGDGTLGVKAIQERGGLTLAQIQDTYGPANPGIPQSAIASGLIDIKAKAEEMGGKLAEYAVGAAQAKSSTQFTSHYVGSLVDLDRELRDTKERLRSTIEEYEATVEELKSSNEELNTINAELIGKVEELDRANNDLRNLFESAQIATVFLDRNLVIRNFTPAASAFFNLRSADVGRSLTDLSNPLDYADLKTRIGQVFATGEIVEHQLTREADRRHFLVRLMPYREEANTIQGVVVSLTDVTMLADAEEHQQVLISELKHRVKNMLAIVISIANSTLEAARPDPAHEALIGRLRAMARIYGALSLANWKEVSIAEIIKDETEPLGHQRFRMNGPQIMLPAQQALSLGMAMHELATNAAKYGALSVPEGHILVTWERQNSELTIQWQERGGPPAVAPSASRFGLALLEGEIAYRHGGKVETHFSPAGLTVRITFPDPDPA